MDIQNNKSVWQKDKDHLIHPYTDFRTFHEEGSQVITSAKGMYVTDTQGNKLMDGIAGLWCVNVGHGREDMAEAISRQVLDMQYYNPFGHTTNEPAAELGAWLAEHAPGTLNHVFYTCGGSTANEAAIRIVHYYNEMRGKHRKKKIISRNLAYHGATYLAANLTGIHATKTAFDRIGEDFVRYVSAANMYAKPDHLSEEQFCDALVQEFAATITNVGADNIGAFIAEPIMGAGGVLVAPRGYHKRIWDLCKANDILYIADEVVTGFGRLGEWFASEAIFGYQPDILISAKGITSGYIPLGATLISDDIYDVISKPQCEGGIFSMGLTYWGHPVACAAALKNAEIIETEGLLANATRIGDRFRAAADSLKTLDHVGDVRGHRLMVAIELAKDPATKESFAPTVGAGHQVFKECLARGLIVRPVGDNLVLSPPLIISAEECDSMIDIIRDAILAFGRTV